MALRQSIPYSDRYLDFTDEETKIDGGVVVGLGTYEPPAEGFGLVIPIAGGRTTDLNRDTVSVIDDGRHLTGGDYNYYYNYDNHNVFNVENNYEYPVLPYVAGTGIIIEGNVISADQTWLENFIKALFYECP
jgi:hypothetical protein